MFDEILTRIRENDPTLTEFNMGNYPLSDEIIIQLAEALENNTFLKKLILHGGGSSRSYCFLCQLKYQKKYTHQGNMTVIGANALSSVNIEILDINDCTLGSAGAIAIARNPHLVDLHLDNCQIEIEGAMAFIDHPRLEEIMLVGNEFDQEQNDWLNRINATLLNNKRIFNPDKYYEEKQEGDEDMLEKTIMKCINPEYDLTPAPVINFEQLSHLLSQLPHGINTNMKYGCTPLYYAVKSNQASVVAFLLSKGALLEATESQDKTALYTAAEEGYFESLSVLLNHGANLTGEFYFDAQTALSIAAFKLCGEIMGMISRVSIENKARLSQAMQILIEKYQETYQEKRQTLACTTFHQQFGHDESLSVTLSVDALTIFHQLKRFFTPENLIEIDNRVKCFRALHNKKLILEKKKPFNSTEINDEEYEYKVEPLLKLPIAKINRLPRQLLQQEIERLNIDLKRDSKDLDWNKYPSLFIVQFRGIHYFSHHFSDHLRNDHLTTWHLNRVAVSPGAAECTGSCIFCHQWARETHRQQAKATVVGVFSDFKNSAPVTKEWGSFENADDAMQERMSNNYQGYKRDVEQGSYSEAAILKDKRIVGYPHYATSDMPGHALRYAFGIKQIAGLQQYSLTPDYDQNGIPKNPYLGKIYLTLFTPQELAAHQSRHVLNQHNCGKIKLRDAVAPERETSIPGGVEAECLFYEGRIEVPDFSKNYQGSYQQRFGLNQKEFTDYKNDFLSPLTTEENRKNKTTELLNHLIRNKENYLLNLAKQEAERRNGYLIFARNNLEYSIEPEPIPQYHISRSDRELLHSVFGSDKTSSAASSSSSTSAIRFHKKRLGDDESAREPSDKRQNIARK